MMTGWIQVDNKIYYMNPTNGGKMTTGTSLDINGTTYNFDGSGVCQNASGVSAQTPSSSSTSASGGVTGENGGPGVSRNSSSNNGLPVVTLQIIHQTVLPIPHPVLTP